jgi:hypothetical protein
MLSNVVSYAQYSAQYGGWRPDEDLTAQTLGPVEPAAGGSLSSFNGPDGTYVYYVGASGALHELGLYPNASNWVDEPVRW